MLHLIESKWTYDAAATGSIGIGLSTASRGKVDLKDPGNKIHEFSYSGFGIGFSVHLPGIKIPPIPIINKEISATGAAKSFSGRGYMFMTSAFRGKELSKSDIQGATIHVDAGFGLLAGYGGSLMFLGIHTALLVPWFINPGLGANVARKAIQSAPAVLLMHGQTEGLIASLGAGLLVGHLQ